MLTDEKLEQFKRLKEKTNKEEEQIKLMYVFLLNNEITRQVVEFVEKVDKLMAVYIHPTGKIGIQSVTDGLLRYKEFKGI